MRQGLSHVTVARKPIDPMADLDYRATIQRLPQCRPAEPGSTDSGGPGGASIELHEFNDVHSSNSERPAAPRKEMQAAMWTIMARLSACKNA